MRRPIGILWRTICSAIRDCHRCVSRRKAMSNVAASDVPDKDLPLRDDIRLLGRILGDTVRRQEGDKVFDIVERIRQTSVRFLRDEDREAENELVTTLGSVDS